MEYKIIIPEWQNYFEVSKKRRPKYYKWSERDKIPKSRQHEIAPTPYKVGKVEYCLSTSTRERFIKNTRSVGKPKHWILNGQGLYNGVLNWQMRKKIAVYFHSYFSSFIKEQIKPIDIPEGKHLSISCDIYEIKRDKMPDVSNMWLLEKFFEDSLTESGIIPDDNPNYVIESGRKRYHWVEDPKDRKLEFTIKIL